jgi:hypothetical protein
MRTITRNVAIIAGVMGAVMGAAASESGTGNRGLSPIVVADAAAKVITPEIVRKINEVFACAASENPSIENHKAFRRVKSWSFSSRNA